MITPLEPHEVVHGDSGAVAYRDSNGSVVWRDDKALVGETAEDNILMLSAYVAAIPLSLLVGVGVGVLFGMIPTLLLMAWSVLMGGSWSVWWVFLPVCVGAGVCSCLTMAGFGRIRVPWRDYV